MATPASSSAYLAWLVVCFVWGTTYLGIRIALETIPPMTMGAIRWIAAGALILISLKIAGSRLPSHRTWPSLILSGFLLIGLGNGGVVWAEQTIPSGLTAVLVAAVPFWMVGVELFSAGSEPLTVVRAAGLVIGFSGIVL